LFVAVALCKLDTFVQLLKLLVVGLLNMLDPTIPLLNMLPIHYNNVGAAFVVKILWLEIATGSSSDLLMYTLSFAMS
jgi:hypothetical protein